MVATDGEWRRQAGEQTDGTVLNGRRLAMNWAWRGNDSRAERLGDHLVS
jgi:hypothetical protein